MDKKPLKASGIGIVVDKSHATLTYMSDVSPFPPGSRLNEGHNTYWKKMKERGVFPGMTMKISDLQRISSEL